MARIRTIKPEFWEDEVIGDLSLGARLLFIAVWNHADDEGLLRWSPAHLKSAAFRYDNNINSETVAAWMREIEEARLVYLYSTARDRSPIAFIINFRRHQRIDKPQAAKMPVPNWRDPAVVEVYARRDEWICPICKDPLDVFDDRSGNVPGIVAERVKVGTPAPNDPTNIRVVHRPCARKVQATAPASQDVDEFQESSENDPGLFPEPSATEGMGRDGKGDGRDVDGAASAPKPRRATQAPRDFEVTQELADWANQKYGFNKARLERETEKFLGHHRAKGTTFKDWTQAWRNWINKADEYNPRPSAGTGAGHQGFTNPTDSNAYEGSF